MDEDNYTAHVFAGLAALELGSYRDAKQHYKSAIASQPAEQLAWKVRECYMFCVLYLRRGHVGVRCGGGWAHNMLCVYVL